jgi:hypothetical protein
VSQSLQRKEELATHLEKARASLRPRRVPESMPSGVRVTLNGSVQCWVRSRT